MECKARLPVLLFVATCLGITSAASSVTLPEECEIPEEDPRCRANLPAWVYNKTSGYCENLPNGKCYKSGNFDTEEDCNTKCRDPFLGICAKKLQEGICRASVRRYSFSPEMRRCRLHMGCYSVEDNGNNFATFKECNKKCGEFAQDPCLLPQEKGAQCRNGRPAPPGGNTYFSFNKETERCESFAYAGCGGNRNRFEEEADCWRVCSKHINNSCNMPISDGHICPRNDQGGRYEAYGYNSKTGRCESFHFKGCGGNSNRFLTAKECWTKCAKSSNTKCLKKAGLNIGGIGIFTRYYYDIDSHQCRSTKHFTKSTKDRNRFITPHECEQECKAAYNGKATWMEY